MDTDFISKAAEVKGITDTQYEAELSETAQSWLKLGVEDEYFALERILEEGYTEEEALKADIL